MTLDEAKALVEEKGIEFFLCSFVEMSGAPKAKVVPVTNIDEMAAEGAGFAGFAAGDMGQGPHSPDMANMPDFDSLMIVPWRRNMAWVAGNIFVEDQPFNYCPRTILASQLEQARSLGYEFKVGVEAEFGSEIGHGRRLEIRLRFTRLRRGSPARWCRRSPGCP